MSPRGFLLVLLLGLCTTQMACGHREARGVADLLEVAKNKLAGMLDKVEDAATSSIETVWNYMTKLEAEVLDSATKLLQQNGIQVDLKVVADLFKSNIQTCVKDENVKQEAKALIDNVATCVTEDINSLKGLVGDMHDLWETAQNVPNAMQDIAQQCGIHGDTDVAMDDLDIDSNNEDLQICTEDHPEVDDVSRDLMESASHHLSKRAIWNLNRISKCINAVYGLSKTDLVTIPGDIMSAATNAFRVVRAAQGGMQTCVAQKVTENSPAFIKLAMSVSSCVAGGVSEGDDFNAAVAASPSLESLSRLSQAADKIDDVKNSNAFNLISRAASFLG